MIVRKPDYYKEFHCIADQCKHTCCMSWEIDVDDRTYADYCKIEGEFGEKLRKSITKDKSRYFKLEHGKCPFLSEKHLCQVYLTLGEDAMSDVCTEYPRVAMEYGDYKELVLGIACEEAGRILFTKEEPIQFEETKIGKKQNKPIATEKNHNKDYSKEIRMARDYCIEILQNREIPLDARLAQFLQFAEKVQQLIDQDQVSDLQEWIEKDSCSDILQEQVDSDRVHELFQQRMDLLADMDVMEEEWSEEINNVIRAFHSDSQNGLYQNIIKEFGSYYREHEYQYENLTIYFAYRYLIEAVLDLKFLVKAKLSIISLLTIRDMDRMRYLLGGYSFTLEDKINTTRIYCKEVEHSKKIMDFLLKKIESEPYFGVDELLTQIHDLEVEMVAQ